MRRTCLVDQSATFDNTHCGKITYLTHAVTFRQCCETGVPVSVKKQGLIKISSVEGPNM